jgi:hypothetical protein
MTGLKRRIFYAGLLMLICSSCATLFNGPTKHIRITTDTPASVVVNNDTIKSENQKLNIEVPRRNEQITLGVFNDTLSKKLLISPKNSFAYWSNLGLCYGLGMLVDMNNPKRYTYPDFVYISMKDHSTGYSTVNTPLLRKKYIVKITPLKIAGLFSPAAEISFEKSTSKNYSSQVMASWLLPKSSWKLRDDFNPCIQGFRVSIEEKYYFMNTAPSGPYLSLELSYLKNKYNDIQRFGIKDIYSDTSYKNTNYSDSISIKKQTLSLNFKFGGQYFINRLSFDLYFGLGIRYKDVRHTGRIKPNDEMEIPRHTDVYYISDIQGKFFTLCMPLNLKIGWAF